MTSDEQKQKPADGEVGDIDNGEADQTLNRAERRAQAKGKKAGAGGGQSSALQNRVGGFSARAAFGVNKTRIPRTGHK